MTKSYHPTVAAVSISTRVFFLFRVSQTRDPLECRILCERFIYVLAAGDLKWCIFSCCVFTPKPEAILEVWPGGGDELLVRRHDNAILNTRYGVLG